MADLEFFFDPVCPFAWVTSRWVKEVQAQREYDVTWRFISLAIINEDRTSDWYTPEYRAGHVTGMMGLRVADELRQTVGNDGVDRLYTALGTAFHNDRRRQEMTDDPIPFLETLLKGADLDPQPHRAGEVTGAVLGRVPVGVALLVDDRERDEPPRDLVVTLLLHLFDPSRRDPCERTHRIEEELEVGHAPRLPVPPAGGALSGP